jgi:hypothetical protein
LSRKPTTKKLIYAGTAIALGAGLVLLALSGRVYSMTIYVPQFLREPLSALHLGSSPIANAVRVLLADPGWDAHELVRKFYSLLAFGVLGFLIAKALGGRPSVSRVIVVTGCVAAFSTIIEVLQRLDPEHESRLSSLLDVLCGAIGGAMGYVLYTVARLSRSRLKR